MNRSPSLVVFICLALLAISAFKPVDKNEQMVSYIADPQKQDIRFYWKDDNGHILKSIAALKQHVETHNRKLVFAMNGGMYQTDNSPLGLFIQDGKLLHPLNTRTGTGNFYMMPNGVLYITKDKKAGICRTEDFKNTGNIRFATQSGPMLLIDGQLHPAFKKGSANLHIRNGVGLLPDGRLLFAISKEPINFYDMADYFKKHGCQNALYLDGFVSRAYIPVENWMQTDGDFGVMIGVTTAKQE